MLHSNISNFIINNHAQSLMYGQFINLYDKVNELDQDVDRNEYDLLVRPVIGSFSHLKRRELFGRNNLDSKAIFAVDTTILEITDYLSHQHNSLIKGAFNEKKFYNSASNIINTIVERDINQVLNNWRANGNNELFDEFIIIIANDNSKAFKMVCDKILNHIGTNDELKQDFLIKVKDEIDNFSSEKCLNILNRDYDIDQPRNSIAANGYQQLDNRKKATCCIIL
jgi:hypothetical protein